MALQEEFRTQGNFLFRYRSNLPLIILLVGVAVFVFQVFFNELHFTGINQYYYNLVCLGVCLFGLSIRILTVGYTPKNTSGRNTAAGQVAEEVNTKGIYSTVRHPLYVGNFFMWLGVSMITQNIWFNIAFVLAYWLYYERIMYAEESFLRDKFGEVYLNWANRTPAFIPSFRNFSRTDLEFSLKKVLRSEKNGFAAIFILFYVFSIIQMLIEKKALVFEVDFWSIAAITSVVIYLILKVIKHNTKLLSQEGR